MTSDEQELRELVSQQTRYNIILNIFSHPQQLPSLPELVWMNPRKIHISKSTFQSHLNNLIEENLVEVVILPENKRKRDLPYRFYGVTEETRRLVTKYKLIRSETSLQILYKQRDKPDEIIRYQNAPRPEC